MFERYRLLKEYCEENEWAAALSALFLVATLGSLIYLLMENQVLVLHWLSNAVLINGLIAIVIALVIAAFSLSLFCLSFSSCSIEERTERVIHRHRPVMSDALKSVKNLGVNPKRRRKQAHNA